MWFDMRCGCSVEVEIYRVNGCCCGECYSYYDDEVEDVAFMKNCEAHTPVDST